MYVRAKVKDFVVSNPNTVRAKVQEFVMLDPNTVRAEVKDISLLDEISRLLTLYWLEYKITVLWN